MTGAKLPDFAIRLATMADLPDLQGLVAESVWVLQANEYNDEQRKAAIRLVYGVDTQLIRDGTYFVVEHGDTVVACGGWSRRRTLFGGDQHRAYPGAGTARSRCGRGEDSRLLRSARLGTKRHRQFADQGLRTGCLSRRIPANSKWAPH